MNFFSFGYLLLAVVSGIAYGFGGTILKKARGRFHGQGGLFARPGRSSLRNTSCSRSSCSGSGYVLYFFIIRKAEVITTTLVIQGVLFMATMVFAALMFKETITPDQDRRPAPDHGRESPSSLAGK